MLGFEVTVDTGVGWRALFSLSDIGVVGCLLKRVYIHERLG